MGIKKAISAKKYALAHPKRIKEAKKRWDTNNKEKKKSYAKTWFLTHIEQAHQKNKEWRLAHPKHQSEYRQSLRGREITLACKARRRQLGFNPINKPFPNSHGHHIDKERIIYMPIELHKSVPHSVLMDKNMEKINSVAFNWWSFGDFGHFEYKEV